MEPNEIIWQELKNLKHGYDDLKKEISNITRKKHEATQTSRRGALTTSGVTAERILKYIYRREGKESGHKPADKLMLDELISELSERAKPSILPHHVVTHLRTVQAWRNLGGHDKGDFNEVIDDTLIGVNIALNTVVSWFFESYLGGEFAELAKNNEIDTSSVEISNSLTENEKVWQDYFWFANRNSSIRAIESSYLNSLQVKFNISEERIQYIKNGFQRKIEEFKELIEQALEDKKLEIFEIEAIEHSRETCCISLVEAKELIASSIEKSEIDFSEVRFFNIPWLKDVFETKKRGNLIPQVEAENDESEKIEQFELNSSKSNFKSLDKKMAEINKDKENNNDKGVLKKNQVNKEKFNQKETQRQKVIALEKEIENKIIELYKQSKFSQLIKLCDQHGALVGVNPTLIFAKGISYYNLGIYRNSFECLNSFLKIADNKFHEQIAVARNYLKFEGRLGILDDFDYVSTGKLKWSKSNISLKHFRNGDLIKYAESNEEWIQAAINHEPAWCYINNEIIQSNERENGVLYNYFAVMDNRNIAPEGWRIANENDWKLLKESYESLFNKKVSQKLKSKNYWNNKNNNTNESGFDAYPAGFRNELGEFKEYQFGAYWWLEANSYNYDTKWLYGKMVGLKDNEDVKIISNSLLITNSNFVNFMKGCGLSVRLIKI